MHALISKVLQLLSILYNDQRHLPSSNFLCRLKQECLTSRGTRIVFLLQCSRKLPFRTNLVSIKVYQTKVEKKNLQKAPLTRNYSFTIHYNLKCSLSKNLGQKLTQPYNANPVYLFYDKFIITVNLLKSTANQRKGIRKTKFSLLLSRKTSRAYRILDQALALKIRQNIPQIYTQEEPKGEHVLIEEHTQ